MILSRIKHIPIIISIPFWMLFMAIDLLKKTNLVFGSGQFLYFYLPGLLLWVLLTDPIYRISKRIKSQKIGYRLLLIGLLGPMFGITKAWLNVLVSSGLGELLTDRSFDFGFPKQFYVMEATIISWIVLIVFLFVDVYSDYQKRLLAISRLQADLRNAELNALKMQIQPHFLFNTHNAIATLLRSNKSKEALGMLLKLSGLLRVALNSFDQQMVPLREELDFIKNYLDIEKVRFEDRLKIQIEVEEDLMHLKVPVFSFQPLIENGIKHGVSKNMNDSLISISATQKRDKLLVKIFNTGEWQSEEPGQGGIGLSNVQNRIENLYGDKASLTVNEIDDGVVVEMTLPIQNTKNS